LNTNLNNDGTWVDFLNSGGFGKYWVTSYVGYMLSDLIKANRKKLNDIIVPLINKIDISKLNGSYNEFIIEDGDSFNFLVGFLNNIGQENKYVDKWLSFFDISGGWVTYNNISDLRKLLKVDMSKDVSGWLLPKSCVSSAACSVLADMPVLKKQFELTSQYLVKKITGKHSLQSYWWNDDIYATSFFIRALYRQTEYRKYCLPAIDWILKRQNVDGSWSNAINEKSAFFTALAIKAIVDFEPTKYRSQIDKGLIWILQNQMTDGSWNSSHILKIPDSNIDDVENITEWKKGSFGYNVVVEDHNRIFTTSTIINTLGSNILLNNIK